ncbi:PepSY domain-containing protein [Campylobacter sp. CCUG 57310]|uniref:PepSY-associated TM helix domain-containing protein n=1 Tax=Campylobacter sp. CCUG 57310 TaxID=2517362 RepID=UPI0015676F45|nr:PepSY-associated TM helix domain-containing protein [Campylobacter sp. CCUG 57310]
MLKLFHRYFGLVFTWVVFFIFFSGTLAYYRDNITLFMQPEYYKLKHQNSNYIDISVDYLTKYHPNSDIWRITPPDGLTPYITVSWKDDAKALEHRRDRKFVRLDPQTGERVKSRATHGGAFLGALHYDLWYIKRITAREIMGYITIVMLFVLISGILIHSRIFKDFFKFKRKMLWYDSHIITGVSGFMIFLMLAISGLYLVERFMLKDIYKEVAIQNKASMQEDFAIKAKARNDERKKKLALIKEGKIQIEQNLTKTTNFIPDAGHIKNIIIANSDRKLQNLHIQKDNPQTAHIQLNFESDKLFTHKGIASEAKVFDLLSGEKIDETFERELDRTRLVMMFMRVFHFGDFGGEAVRLIFFFFGCLGMVMCVSGSFFWMQKQHSKAAVYTVKILNNTFFIGLFTAFGVYLLSNQVMPDDLALRHQKEITGFFISLGTVFMIGAVFIRRYSYAISSILTSVIFLAVFVISLKNGAYYNFEIFKISILCLLISVMFSYVSFKFIKGKA